MIREDRELLAKRARLTTTMAPLALCIMNGTASIAEQHNHAWRLIATAQRLTRRAAAPGETIVEGEVVVDGSIALPAPTTEPPWIREHRW